MFKELIESEIKLADDECCIIFDLSCYFPYSNVEVLTFDFSLGMEEINDYKLNHRYPNQNYQTISKKYGKKVSKLGYPYIMKLNEQCPMLLCLKVGIKDVYSTLIFPILTNMTKEKPFCSLNFRYYFDDHHFVFRTSKKIKDGIYESYYWRNFELEVEHCGINMTLKTPSIVCEEERALLYKDIIVPCAETSSDINLV